MCSSLQVYRTPTVGVLSTGDELVEPTTRNLGCGQVLHKDGQVYFGTAIFTVPIDHKSLAIVCNSYLFLFFFTFLLVNV